MVYEEGHISHNKWQIWLWEMGVLRGMFECLSCGLFWESLSPPQCSRCDAGRELLIYREVPVESEEYLIFGSADGDVFIDEINQWVLIEVKTIGQGTIRIDAPALLKKYSYEHIDPDGKTHTGVDWQRLWNGIKFPFPSHLRQGMIYCFCHGRKTIRFIYEPLRLGITAWPKEFEVSFSKRVIEDILEQCTVVKVAIEKGKAPRRPMWAAEGHSTCKYCAYRSKCYGKELHSRQEGSGEQRIGPPRTSRVRYTKASN